MVYTATLSESPHFICWRLILEDFGTNIQHISGVDNIVYDTLSILPSTYFDKYDHITKKA